MEFNSVLLGARYGLRPTGTRPPVTVIHPPDAIVECSPAGKPLVRGTVFGPAVVVEDVDGVSIDSDYITPVSSSVVRSNTSNGRMTYGGASHDAGTMSEDELERILEQQMISDADLAAYGGKKATSGEKKEALSEKKKPFGGKKTPFFGEKDFKLPRANKTAMNGFSDLLMIDTKGAPRPDPTPPPPPPRFSSKASTLPRFRGQKPGPPPPPPKRDFHKITFQKRINLNTPTSPMEGRRSPIFMTSRGRSTTLPRNMGRSARGEYRSSLLIPTGRSTSLDPQYISTLPAAYHSHLVRGEQSRVFTTSPLMSRKFDEDWAYLTTDDEDDVFYAPSEPYVPPIPKETYREIPVVKSSPLSRSISYDNVFFFKTNAKPTMMGRPLAPASSQIIQACTYDSLPRSAPLQRKPYGSLTQQRKPGYGCPPLVSQRSSSMFAVNRLLSNSDRNQEVKRLTPSMDYLDKGRATSFTALNTLPPQYTNGHISPLPYQNGRISPYGKENRGVDTGRISPFPVENGRISPFPTENGRASPYLSDVEIPFQEVKVIPTMRPVSPFITDPLRSSPYMGRSSPYPSDPPHSPSPIRYMTGRTSPYLQQNKKSSEKESTIAVTSVTPVFTTPLSSAVPDPGDDYDNLQTGSGSTSLPVGTTKSATSVRFQNGNDVGTKTGSAMEIGTGSAMGVGTRSATGISTGTGSRTGTGTKSMHGVESATFLDDDYDNLGVVRSSSAKRRVDIAASGDHGGVGMEKVDKAIDNPRFPHNVDQRRTSLVWVKGYR